MTPSLVPVADTTFELRAGALRLAVRPDIGGSIAGLWHGSTPVLRSTEPARLARAHDAASFALVPYSNRIAYHRFRWKGRDYASGSHFDDGPHSLHGIGWMRGWDVLSHSGIDLVLRLRHEADGHWPFAFEAQQSFALTPDALVVQTAVTNTDTVAQPAGVGWHPYFPKRARSRLHVDCSGRWDNDPTLLPVRRVAQPGIDADVAHLSFDNIFDGWSGPAHIRDEKFSLHVRSSLPYLVVYAQQDKDFFCVEPVSHVNNAIHMSDPAAHGLRTLQPGESLEASMRIDVAVL
jgi:aldose 1-epimerase